MATKKRTKLEKQQAQARRSSVVADSTEKVHKYQFQAGGKAAVPTKTVTAERVLGYDLPVLYRDLAKTAGIAAIILSILVGLVVLTPYF